MAAAICRGDVVLIDDLGQGWISASIAVGELIRFPGSPYAQWTHIAIVYHAPVQDPKAILIVEATATSGVHTAYLSKYEHRYAIVHTSVSTEDWWEVKKFLDSVLALREGYGFVTYVGLTLYALTGTGLCIQRAGTATCGGLVADALTRPGFIWTRPPYAMTPARIAADLEQQGCAIPSGVEGGGKTTLVRNLLRRRK